MVDPFLELPPPNRALTRILAENADGILETIGQEHGVSTFEVVRALPAEHCRIAPASKFEEIMADLTAWGDVLIIVHTPSIVLECKGPIPPGSFARGYYNVHGDSPIGGHIKADRCAHIAFVSRPFMGRHSCSVQFFDLDGSAMFKVFVGRDERRELIFEQVSKFQTLRERVCA